MPTSGRFSCSLTDYDNEHGNLGFNIPVLTAANFDAQQTLMNTFIAALMDMVLGYRWKNSQAIEVLNNIESPNVPAAQVELKWLVQYHDPTSLKRYTFEIPTANTARLDENDRSHAEIGDGAEVDAFISALEAYGKTPDGGAIVVDEITLVGRPV